MKARCPVCGRDVALKKDGSLRGHGYTQASPYWCEGEWPAKEGEE